MTDRELMILVRDNDDRAAFNELCARWAEPLFRYFRRRWRLQAADAEDCTQDTLQNVWNGRKTYRDEYPFRFWIYGIAFNVAYNCKNRPGGRGLIGGQARLLFKVPLGPEDELDCLRISDALRGAFADENRPLPDHARVEVVMKEWEWTITWWIKSNDAAEYEKKGYQVKRTQGLDIYSLGVVMELFNVAEEFNTPSQSESEIVAEAELFITLFHARSEQRKRVLRYRYWPKDGCDEELVEEYERLLGVIPQKTLVPTPSFARWVVARFNSPSGTTTSHVRCLEETGVGNVTVGKVFLRFALEYQLSAIGQEDKLRELLSVYVSQYPKANEPRLIYRWYSRAEANGDPDRDGINAIFLNQQPPADANLAYFIRRSQQVPSSFTDDVEAEPDEMPELTESWNQYREGVLKTLLARL